MTTPVGPNTNYTSQQLNALILAALFGSPQPNPLGASQQRAVQVASGSTDAIVIPGGLVFVTSSGVDAMTLANPVAGAPSAGGQDGLEIKVYCQSAHAHTITTGTNGINGANHVVTFTAAAGNGITLTAYNGTWYTTGAVNATIS